MSKVRKPGNSESRMSLKSSFTSISSVCSIFFIINLSLNQIHLNPLSANRTKWSNTFEQFVGKLPTNCLNVFDPLKGLM